MGPPASLPAVGSHTPTICSLSHHTHSHPLVVYVLSNFSLQLLLLLGQVVITVNCASVCLLFRPCPAPSASEKGDSFFLFFKNTWCHFLFLKSCPDDQNNARILYMVLNQYTFSNILKKIRLNLVPFIKALKKRWSELTSSGTDYKTCTLGTYRFTKLNVCILLPAFVKKSGFCCLLLGVFFLGWGFCFACCFFFVL